MSQESTHESNGRKNRRTPEPTIEAPRASIDTGEFEKVVDVLKGAGPAISVTINGKVRKGTDDAGEYVQLEDARLDIHNAAVLASLAEKLLR